MATYYIAANGSTSNVGTSPNFPWPLSKVGSVTYAAGDIILFNKGDTFSGTIAFASSGSSGNPITFDFYGDAADNPIIDGGASSSNVLNITGNYITINNLVFQNSTSGNGVILLSTGVHDIIINNCYINTGIRGIYAFHCGSSGVANIKVLSCFFTNISDTTGFPNGGGNHVQFDTCSGSGIEVAYNKCYTPVTPGSSTTPYVGDILSVYKSNGTSSSYIFVHDNQIRGGGSQDFGKAGIVLGDGGGSYQKAYNNICINTGSSCFIVQGGTFIDMSNNIGYSAEFPYSEIAMALGNYSGLPCNNITMGNNKLNLTNKNGNIFNSFIDTSGNSTSTGVAGGAPLATPTGWSTNTAATTADPYAYDALLPNPLFQQGDWNINSFTGEMLITTPPANYVTGGMQTILRNSTTGRLESLLGNYLPNPSGTDAAYTINLNDGDFVYLPAITAARTVTFPLVVDGKIIIIFNQNSSAFAWSVNSAPAVKTASLSAVTSITNQTATMYIGSASVLAWIKIV